MAIQVGDNKFGAYKWIVDPVLGIGTHQTLVAAVASASNGDSIRVNPGSYTGDFDAKSLTIVGDFNRVTLTGKCTVGAGINLVFDNVGVATNSDNFLVVSGAGSTVSYRNCQMNCSNADGIVQSEATSTVRITNSSYDVGATRRLFNNSAGSILLRNVEGTNSGSSSNPSVSAGSISLVAVNSSHGFATSGAGIIDARNCNIDQGVTNLTCITLAGTGTSSIYNSYIASGTAVGVSIGAGTTLKTASLVVNSSNAAAIDGAGTLSSGSIDFVGSSFAVTTTTQTTLSQGPRLKVNGVELLAGAGSPNASVTSPQGSLFLATNGSSASTRAYSNTDGATAWTSVTTAT